MEMARGSGDASRDNYHEREREGEFCRAARRARAYIDEKAGIEDELRKNILWIKAVKELYKSYGIKFSVGRHKIAVSKYIVWTSNDYYYHEPEVIALGSALNNALDIMEEDEIIRYAMGKDDSYITIDDRWKAKATTYIFHIRDVVAKSDIGEAMRERIFSRLNQLQSEIDRNRTRVESISEVFLVVTEAVGKGARRLEPAVRIIERLAGAFSGARTAAVEHEKIPKFPAPENLGLSDLEEQGGQ
jgi:hypothetical protein